jgi:polysaccharide export outer membrane protein
LGLAGDMTLWGTRENVLVIRESEAGKSFTRVDITAADLFQSPVYYLEQNDVVYVEPNKPKINNSATSATTGIIISITSLVITVISLIVR